VTFRPRITTLGAHNLREPSAKQLLSLAMSKIISPDSAHAADGLAPHSDDVSAIATGTSIFFTS
jgi:hypothetical protein